MGVATGGSGTYNLNGGQLKVGTIELAVAGEGQLLAPASLTRPEGP